MCENFFEQLQQFGAFLRLESASFLDQKIKRWKESRGFFLSMISCRLPLRQWKVKVMPLAIDTPIHSGSFDAALIDEFQDTDPVQFHIFRKFFAETNKHWLYLIGDPKQSIYRFRGADLEAYFSFARETGASVFSLDKNFRTTSSPGCWDKSPFCLLPSDSPFHHPQLLFSSCFS